MNTITTEMLRIYQNDYMRGLNSDLDSVLYRKMPNTRRAGIVINFTQDEFFQIMQVHTNPCMIAGYLGISLRQYQEALFHNYTQTKFYAVHSSRQMGVTTISHIIALYEAVIKGKTVSLVLPKNANRVHSIEQIKELYCRLPFFLQSGLLSADAHGLIFENGGRITGVLGAKDLVGYNGDTYILDNVSDKEFASIINYVVPSISAGIKAKLLVIASGSISGATAKVFDGATRVAGDPKKNGFILQKIGWWEVPSRDSKWKDKQIEMLGSEELFDAEYDIH